MNNDIKNTKAKVLIIDDDVNMMEILSVILEKYNCSVSTFTEPVSAIETLKSENYDILLVNYLMTPVNGDKIVELVREFDKEIYIILMSTHKDLAPSIDIMQNLDIQAYFEKSSRFDELVLLVQGGIKYIEQVNKVQIIRNQMDKHLIEFAKILLNTISAKDHYTEEHSERVSKLATLFGEKLNLEKKDIENLKIAALFHDIGKIGIPDKILLKTDKLTDEEYDIIKLHPIIGANIFSSTDIFREISPIIRYHHERIDGKGYPEKLKGNDIPYLARVLAICDSFDAIVSKRPYKEETTIEYALGQIDNAINTQFDKDLAIKFKNLVINNIEKIQEIL